MVAPVHVDAAGREPRVSVDILIADDHPVVRKGVGMILRADPRLRVVAEAEDGAEALTMGFSSRRRPRDSRPGDAAAYRVRGRPAAGANRPRLKVLILSMYDDPRYVNRARKVGAHGYLLKSTVDRELLSACHAVLAGGAFVEPQASPVARQFRPRRMLKTGSSRHARRRLSH